MSIFNRAAVAVFAAAALTSRTEAQRVVRGNVHDSASGTPVAGAVVSVIGSDGRVLVHGITDAAGAFRLPVTGRATGVHVVRIGFLPRDIELAADSGAPPIAVAMLHIPPLLDAVRVTGQTLCPAATADHDRAFAIWEQARAGLLATVVARDAKPATARWLLYERHETPGDSLILRQVVRRRTGPTTRPFAAAATARELAERGYTREDAAGRTFLAPDADVLLDDSFAATHCFGLRTNDSEHPGQIGVVFTPVERHDTAIDVAGVIWIDLNAWALRSLEFRYSGLDGATARGTPGGRIEFRTVSNGVSFIDRWALRIPIVEIRQSAPASITRDRITASRTTPATVSQVFVSGGAVTSAHWADSVTWSDVATGVSGKVIEHGGAAAVGNAVVTFDGTADTLSTDSLGRFELVPMLPGRYRMRVADTTLAAYGRDRTDSRIVDVMRGQVLEVRSELPAISESIAQVCRRPLSTASPAMLTGRVALPANVSPASASLRVTWRAPRDRILNGSGLQHLELHRDAELDARGRFVVCGLPFEQPIRLHLSFAGSAADTSLAIHHSLVGSIEWHPVPHN